MANGRYWDHRVTGAQARSLRAMDSLARVRRLATHLYCAESLSIPAASIMRHPDSRRD